MNEKERLILKFITENPFLSQNELAEKTDLSRSAVAGYIASLMKQGRIIGRAYVVPNRKQIICIGGSNVDRKIQTHRSIVYGTSNPAKSTQSIGGVARNVAENLGRLGLNVALMSVVGDDHEGEWLLTSTSNFVDTSLSQVLPNEKTGTYTAILDETGEMIVALADMNIYDAIETDFMMKRWGYITNADVVLLDTNFQDHHIEEIINRCATGNIPLCIVPVSSPKVKKLPKDLTGVTWFIANKDEAEALTGLKIEKEVDYVHVANEIIRRGVHTVVITKGKQGVMYFTKNGETTTITPSEVKVTDVTGAGDSFAAGMMYGVINGYSIHDACQFGLVASSITLQTEETVNPNLTEKLLKQLFDEKIEQTE